MSLLFFIALSLPVGSMTHFWEIISLDAVVIQKNIFSHTQSQAYAGIFYGFLFNPLVTMLKSTTYE